MLKLVRYALINCEYEKEKERERERKKNITNCDRFKWPFAIKLIV